MPHTAICGERRRGARRVLGMARCKGRGNSSPEASKQSVQGYCPPHLPGPALNWHHAGPLQAVGSPIPAAEGECPWADKRRRSSRHWPREHERVRALIQEQHCRRELLLACKAGRWRQRTLLGPSSAARQATQHKGYGSAVQGDSSYCCMLPLAVHADGPWPGAHPPCGTCTHHDGAPQPPNSPHPSPLEFCTGAPSR